MVSSRILPKILLAALVWLGSGDFVDAQSSPDTADRVRRSGSALLEREIDRLGLPARITEQLRLAGRDRDRPAKCLERASKTLSLLTELLTAHKSKVWAQAYAHALRSWGAQGLGNYDEALTEGRAALDLAESLGDKGLLLAEAKYYLAVAEWRHSNHEPAIEYATAATKIQRRVGNLHGLCRTFSLLGAIHRSMSEFDLSIEFHLEALTIGEETNDEAAIARANNNVGLVYWELDRLDDAHDALSKSFALNARLGHKRAAAKSAANVALIHIERGEPAKALPLLEHAQLVYNETGDRHGMSLVLGNFGYAYQELGDRKRAIDFYERSLALREEIGAKRGIVRARATLAKLHIEANGREAAREILEAALALAEEVGARSEEAAILELLAQVHNELGDSELAYELHERFHEIESEITGQDTINRIAILEARHGRKRREREVSAAQALAASRAEQRDWLIAGSALLATCVLALLGLSIARSRAQRAVVESERRYRRLFDNSTTPTFVIEQKSGTLVDSNEPARALCPNIAGPESIKVDSLEPEWVRVALTRLLEDDATNDPALDDCWIERSGRLRWTEVRGCAVTLQGRDCQLVTVRDTTELRTHEQARLREDKMEALGLLAGGIAHDFNNVLTSIIGHVGLARDGSAAERGEMLEVAERAAAQARGLTSQLLAFSKGGEPVRRIEDTRAVLREAVELATAGSSLNLTIETPNDLWPAMLDNGQFSQVVSNLIINAQQATGSMGNLRIHASNFEGNPTVDQTDGHERFVRIDFEDDGPGIPEHIRDHIFDPYFTTKDGGSGLGLATAFAIVKHHGGALRFESRTGQGTTFSTFFPATTWKAPTRTMPVSDEPSGGGCILVLDDEELVRSVIAKTLERWGFRVEAVAEGSAAVARYRERLAAGQPFDLLIMDLTIPGGMGGRDAMAEILAIDPRARAIVASGYSEDPTMAHYREAGFSAALAKPFRREDLALAINSVLGRSESQRTGG